MDSHASLISRTCRLGLLAVAVIALLPGTALPAKGRNDPARVGRWGAPFPWPDVAIHLHLLPNGNILTYADDDHPDYHKNGSRGANHTHAYVWDIGTSASPQFHQIHNESTNLFCSGHSFLPDGRLLIMGGHEGRDGDGSVDTNIFDIADATYGGWSRGAPMSSGRWYPTACSLANGDVLTVSGTGSGTPNIPEVWTPNVWRQLTGANLVLSLYPFLHLAPNGKVFMSGPDRMARYLDTTGAGAWTNVANRIFGLRDYGSAVQYGDGKILVMGGGDPPTSSAEVIDLNGASPSWRSVSPMAHARRHLNATLLPDGTVLVTGGTSSGGFNSASGAVYVAELLDPATERFTKLSSMQVKRLYHSSALLLPDGRVLSAGGGRPAATGEDPLTEHRDAEIYSPPYLFKGARPTVTTAPEVVHYGERFPVDTPDAPSISKVTLIRLSSVTHAFNQNQRINRLSFQAVTGGLYVTAPPNPNLCPPGHYMLFILNGSGVPSIARVVQIQ